MLASIFKWLRSHSVQVHSVALVLMVGASFLLYQVAKAETDFFIWGLLSLFIFANFLELAIQ